MSLWLLNPTLKRRLQVNGGGNAHLVHQGMLRALPRLLMRPGRLLADYGCEGLTSNTAPRGIGAGLVLATLLTWQLRRRPRITMVHFGFAPCAEHLVLLAGRLLLTRRGRLLYLYLEAARARRVLLLRRAKVRVERPDLLELARLCVLRHLLTRLRL